MAYYKLGPILRERRIVLGYTQEELADGICAVNTISRYENGERMPNKEHLEMLLSRLGYSDAIFDVYLDEKTFCLHELKYRIRQSIKEHRHQEASDLLQEFEQAANPKSRISQQFIQLYRTRLDMELSEEEKLLRFEQALKITCPYYPELKSIPVLSYEEIILMNNIAIQHSRLNELETSISILEHVVQYYEIAMVNREESLRTQPMILYNLSKYLGNAGRYDECIAVCNRAIHLAQMTGRCFMLAATMYNKAWVLTKRRSMGDLLAAEETARRAMFLAECMQQEDLQKHVERFINETLVSAY